MALFHDLINNPQNKVIINGVQGAPRGVIESFLLEDFTISTESEFSAGRGSQEWEEMINTYMKSLATMANRMKSINIEQVYVRGIHNTVKSWVGTGTISFRVPLVFVAVNPEDDVRRFPTILASACSPGFGGDPSTVLPGLREGAMTFRVHPPNNYMATNMADQRGTVSLRIGTWFATKPVFILKSSSVTYSSAVLESTGLPLMARCDVALESFRVLSRREIADFMVLQGA